MGVQSVSLQNKYFVNPNGGLTPGLTPHGNAR
jgi:hypothetical protein